MKTEGQKRFSRGWSKKRKEIEVFLIDNENDRLNSEYGKVAEKKDEGIGVGRYPPDYLDGFEILSKKDEEKTYQVMQRKYRHSQWEIIFESKSEWKAMQYFKKAKKENEYLKKLIFI